MSKECLGENRKEHSSFSSPIRQDSWIANMVKAGLRNKTQEMTQMTNFVNMTAHPINIVNDNMTIPFVIEPSGETIRLDEEWSVATTQGASVSVRLNLENGGIFHLPILVCKYTASGKLPEKVEGTIYIVSAMVAKAYPYREDFLIPAKMVRDHNGHICGCESLAHV